MARQKKAKVGDICEIGTPAGLAYVQYTHDGGDKGELVRVLPGLFAKRPPDFAELAKQRELYFIFYTLNYALRHKQAEIVSHQEVPQWAQPHPLMRWAGLHEQGGRAIAWKIFKASEDLTIEMHQRIPVIRSLTPDQERLSIHQIRPHAAMVRELARGWTPERAEELRLQYRAMATERKKGQLSGSDLGDRPMRHYLYFAKKENAEHARNRLRDGGFSVQVRRGAGGEDWLVLAMKAPPTRGEAMETLRDELEGLATGLDGEYDGWELELEPLQTSNIAPNRRIN